MKKVLVFGTFDNLHKGHLSFFSQARKIGDKLVVVVARDKTVWQIKKQLPVFSEAERLAQVSRCKNVDEAFLGSTNDKYEILRIVKPDVICLGYDQIAFVNKLAQKLIEYGLQTEIRRLKPYKEDIYKSSKLKGI